MECMVAQTQKNYTIHLLSGLKAMKYQSFGVKHNRVNYSNQVFNTT